MKMSMLKRVGGGLLNVSGVAPKRNTIQAKELAHGHIVQHSGEWYRIVEVSVTDIAVCCITSAGGRISFGSNTQVRVK